MLDQLQRRRVVVVDKGTGFSFTQTDAHGGRRNAVAGD